jgi:hypothetical protein
MPRLFTAQVFNMTLNYTNYVFSDPAYNDQLGQADGLVLEVICDSAPANATIYVETWTSNDNVNWLQLGSAGTLAVVYTNAFPQSAVFYATGLTSNLPGAFVRLQVKTTSGAGDAIRVIASGRVM